MAKEQQILSKEEILDRNSPNAGKGVYDFSGEKSDIFDAMDEYAKQQAIAFRNWEPPVGNYNSDEDLYEIFEQKKNK